MIQSLIFKDSDKKNIPLLEHYYVRFQIKFVLELFHNNLAVHRPSTNNPFPVIKQINPYNEYLNINLTIIVSNYQLFLPVKHNTINS